MATKANHHYIPQFYLRGFSDGIGRKAKVFTFDIETGSAFSTLVRNVGSKRNFFRVDVDGVDPNAVENAMAEVESRLARHLAEVVQTQSFPSEDHYESVMNLVANLSVRNPRLRKSLERSRKRMAELIADLVFSSKEVFENQKKRMFDEGFPIDESMTYEEMKQFHDRKEYDLVVDQTQLVKAELKMLQPVVECSSRRNWCFVQAPKGHQYISSDDPAVLTWTNGSKMGNHPPGHGLEGTLLLLSLSSTLLLVGTFESLPERFDYSVEQLVTSNTMIARHSTRQIYARDGSFMLRGHDGCLVRGTELPNHFKFFQDS